MHAEAQPSNVFPVVDSHAHVDAPEFDDDRDAMLRGRALQASS